MLVEKSFPAKPRALQQHIFHLLPDCNSLKNITQIHSQIITNGFSQKNYILVKLLSAYTTSGLLINAHKVFKNVINPSTTLCNQMIRGFAGSEMPHKCVELFNQMRVTDAQPDGFTYSYLLSGCARSGMAREGEQVHGRVLADGYGSNLFVNTNLVNLYVMSGGDYCLESARRLFDEMGERNVVCWNSMLKGFVRCGNVDGARWIFDEMPERSVVTWTTMISGYAKSGKCRQALFLFNEMRRARVGLDQVALLSALSACGELGNLRLGRWIHSYMQKTLSSKSQPLLISLSNSLIHMYASCGEIKEAYEVFRWMQQRSAVSWTTMIIAFAKVGYAQEALHVFQLMQSVGAKEAQPDDITFIGILCACSHGGFVDEGCQIFKNMTQSWGIKPRIEHYGCMIDLLSRAGFLDEALHLVETMPMKPNHVVWGALLGGCRIHKNVELASNVARKVIVQLDPDLAAGYLVLLAQVYASGKMWQDVAAVRRKMVEMGVRKPAGQSWVQVNGAVHDFIACDRTHKHAVSIYKMLSMITREAKLEGCEAEISTCFPSTEGV